GLIFPILTILLYLVIIAQVILIIAKFEWGTPAFIFVFLPTLIFSILILLFSIIIGDLTFVAALLYILFGIMTSILPIEYCLNFIMLVPFLLAWDVSNNILASGF